MKKPDLVEGFAILMFVVSLAMTVGLSIYKGDISIGGVWWMAACINTHSLVSLAMQQRG